MNPIDDVLPFSLSDAFSFANPVKGKMARQLILLQDFQQDFLLRYPILSNDVFIRSWFAAATSARAVEFKAPTKIFQYFRYDLGHALSEVSRTS